MKAVQHKRIDMLVLFSSLQSHLMKLSCSTFVILSKNINTSYGVFEISLTRSSCKNTDDILVLISFWQEPNEESLGTYNMH